MQPTSKNCVDFLLRRERGTKGISRDHHFGLKSILTYGTVSEHGIPLYDVNVNKVTCCKWLSSNNIIFGSTDSRLIVYNLLNNSFDEIPTISSGDAAQDRLSRNRGISFLKKNPSCSLLVTRALNSNKLGVYRLPTLDPFAITESGHTDSVYDALWLDDQFVVSVCVNLELSLWHFPETNNQKTLALAPLVKRCEATRGIWTMSFNKSRLELACLSIYACVHVFSVPELKKIKTKILPNTCVDTVCIAVNDEGTLYAIGGRHFITLIDAASLDVVKLFGSYLLKNIRSISFHGKMLTFTTIEGGLCFHDIRQTNILKTIVKMYPHEGTIPMLITHEFDSTLSRIFVAGGPLKTNMIGYASLWQ